MSDAPDPRDDYPRDDSGDATGAARDDSSDATGAARDDALTHLDGTGTARMVDVGAKDVTARSAVARARLTMAPRTAALLAAGDLPKGDALAQARIAGMMAAKRTWELLPLCHQVALTSVDVEIDVDVDAATCDVVATARASDRTGVEMEAMVAVTTAALAVYDMVKAVQRDVVIGDVRVVRKQGGRSGTWELDG